MTDKIFSIVAGVLLILGGIFYFFKGTIDISYTAICAIVLGFAFTTLYFKKQKSWAILPGIYLLYIGVTVAFFKNVSIYNYLLTSTFFLAPGSIFAILYYSANRKNYLLSLGLILLSTGISVILIGLYDFDTINIFLLCLGVSLVVNYILSKNYSNKAPLILGIIVMLLSARKFLVVNGYTDIIISMALVIVGFSVIVRTLIDK